METYISILRGVNLGSHNKISKQELIDIYNKLGCKNVTTYIQSGNVIFRNKKTLAPKLANKISGEIKSVKGYNVPVIVIALEEFKNIIASNPFKKEIMDDAKHVHITFLSETPEILLVQKLDSETFLSDRFIINNRVVYLYVPGSYAETKLSNSFFEKKLKVSATTRNWRTSNELLAIAQKL